MSALTRRDRLGSRRIFVERRSGARAADLRSLLTRYPEARAGLDPIGVAAAWGLREAPERTCLRSVGAIAPGPDALEPCGARAAPDLETGLVAAAGAALRDARRPVVALGGGIDAPLAVLAARRAGRTVEDALHVSMPGTTYDEAALARETASALGLALHAIVIDIDALARELPRAVRLAETPLYNLHPVGRVLVARVALELGYDALLTGDGADQAARGATEPADYVPIVAAITRGTGLSLASPFLDEPLVELLVDARDPQKKALRELAVAWGLPRALAERAKVACHAPPLPRAFFPSSTTVEVLARALGEGLAWSSDDRRNVGITSLAAFVAAFEVGAA